MFMVDVLFDVPLIQMAVCMYDIWWMKNKQSVTGFAKLYNLLFTSMDVMQNHEV